MTASAVDEGTRTQLEAAAVRAFLRRVEGARLRSHLQVAFVSSFVPLLCVVLLIALGAETAAIWIGGLAAVAVAIVLGSVLVRERRSLRRALLELRMKGQPIGDLLLAWDEVERRGADGSSMAQWLRSDLAAVVAALPKHTEARWLAPRLGSVRYAVPLAVALLLLYWLRPQFDLPIFGLAGAPPPPPPVASRPSDGNSPTANDSSEPQPGEDPPREEAPTKEPSPPPAPEQGPPPEPEAPAPFLDLPAKAEVVVPEFTRDGPTRKALAERALTGGGEGGTALPPPPTSSSGGDGSRRAPPLDREEFRRAEERALQSRRVPERERAMVRTFFRLLQEDGK
ncbi:MAG: hypothetical protein ABL997_13805 [Planctomycetota bacterium]